MYAALATGDLTIGELLEFTLHFAVYCGWPKASQAETILRRQHARLQEERGARSHPGPITRSAHSARVITKPGSPAESNVSPTSISFPSPPRDSPYFQAGILSFVFGHLWQRPALSRIDRRYVTVPCVGVSDALTPIHSHVGSALGSGDISPAEMNELILQFAAYSGFAKAEVLNDVAAEEWARLQSQT